MLGLIIDVESVSFLGRGLSNQEPSGPNRQTSPALGLVIEGSSVTAGVGAGPQGLQGAHPGQQHRHCSLHSIRGLRVNGAYGDAREITWQSGSHSAEPLVQCKGDKFCYSVCLFCSLVSFPFTKSLLIEAPGHSLIQHCRFQVLLKICNCVCVGGGGEGLLKKA